MSLKLGLLSGFTFEASSRWAKAGLMPTAIVSSDGLGCFGAVTGAGCIPRPKIGGAFKPRDLPEYKLVNTVLGNLKTTPAGVFKALTHGKSVQHNLAAFANRFNSCFDLRSLLAEFIVNVGRTSLMKGEFIRREHADRRF